MKWRKTVGKHQRKAAIGGGIKLLLGGAAIVAALGLAGAAWAYFTSHGSGLGAAAAGTLQEPVIASATPGAGTVALSWAPGIAPPGAGTVTYYVTRDNGAPAGNCPTSGLPTTATSCTDTGLSAGNHSYTVTTRWKSWTATSASKNVTSASGAATKIVLSGSSGPLGSGATSTYTATIEDATGNPVTSGADSTDALTFSQTTGTGSVTFATPSATVSGVAADVVTGNLTGPVTIKAAGTVGGTATSSNTLSFTVIPGALDHFVVPTPAGTAVLAPSAPSVTASCIFQCNTTWSYEVSAVNASGQTMAGTSASVKNNATLSTNFDFNTVTMPASLPAGATSFNVYRSTNGVTYGLVATGESVSAQLKDTGLSTGVAPPSTNTTASITVGTAFSETITALDARGNPANGWTSTTDCVTFSGPSVSPNNTNPIYGSQGSCGAGQTSLTFNASGQATLSITPFAAEASTLTATSVSAPAGKTGVSGQFTVVVGTLDHFGFAAASSQTNGVAFTGTNTLTALDVGGNTVTNFSASANNVTITAVSPLTGAVSGLDGAGNVLSASGEFVNGVADLTAQGMIYTGNATTETFTATSATGSKTGTSGSVVISPGALASFTFSAASPQTNGVAFTGTNTLTALDASGNTITNFNASTNNVTIIAVSPLTGAVSGLDGAGNVLSASGEFVNGVADLTAQGMIYTGNATTGTFKATSATGSKTGTSGSVVISPGALASFTFSAAGAQTNGVAFTGTNTLTAKDTSGNTITNFNASTNNVTITPVSPLTGTVSGLDTPANVLNQAGDFTSGVANLTSLGMIYTGNATTGTFKATSATGSKTGTSGSVVISPGALASFTFSAASAQTDGVTFTGTNTLTALDASGNIITNFNASTNNVTITANSPLTSAGVSGLDTPANVLNQATDFSSGAANLTSLGMIYTGNIGSGTFTATSGTKTGTSGSVTIGIGTLDHFAFAAASPQTDGVAFTGTNTLTAQDVGNNTITTYSAATNSVTITPASPLTGTVSGLHGSNVLNQAGDFTSGVANLTSLGMIYTGNATTGTFKATSATGSKTGTSGSVVISVGGLDHFALVLATPQTSGVAFAGTNTLTAQDVGNNTITTYSAATNSVTITPVSPLTGTVSGLDTPANVLNQAGDFTSGVANLTSLGMIYTGNATTGTFKATSATGSKTGTSGSVVISPGALASFTFSAASAQTDGVTFTGTNTLTALDASGNIITNFNASTNNVTITANSPLTSAGVSGLDTPANVLNQATDFSSGAANLTSLGMIYTGNIGSGTFTATSGTKTGTSGSVTIGIGTLDHFAFAAASPQTDGVAFTGTNTLTAQDVGNNTITTYSAATNSVTITPASPLTGTVSGLHGSNVLNQAGDFTSGVANLTSLGMIYTGNATTGTFKATSATGSKTGTSGSVVISVGGLDHFALVLATPQTSGVAFAGTNTLTAQDVGNNTITTYSAATNSVTITPVSPLTGTVSGLDTPANVLNQAGDFTSGVANLTSLGMIYTGNATTGTFKATSATGSKTGTSGSVVINVATQTYAGSTTTVLTGPDYYRIDAASTGSGISTANSILPGVAETLRSFSFSIDSASGTTHTATVGLLTGGAWAATGLTCSITGGSGQTSCTVTANVSVSATQSISVRATGNGNHIGTWSTTYTRP